MKFHSAEEATLWTKVYVAAIRNYESLDEEPCELADAAVMLYRERAIHRP